MENKPCLFLYRRFDENPNNSISMDVISAKCDLLGKDLAVGEGKPLRPKECPLIANEVNMNCGEEKSLTDLRIREAQQMVNERF